MTSKSSRLSGLAKEFDALLAASSSTLVVHEFTSTPGQTTFTGADGNGVVLNYLPGSVLVALDGVLLHKTADYAATNGTSVVLTQATTGIELLQVFAFGTFTVANHYTKAEDDALLAAKYSKTNILGAVSQTGGVPTGAIIETGTNVNGTTTRAYTKWADGTLHCTAQTSYAGITTNTASGALFAAAAAPTLDYLAPFTRLDSNNQWFVGNGIALFSPASGFSSTTTWAALAPMSLFNTGATTYPAIHYREAWGRWF